MSFPSPVVTGRCASSKTCSKPPHPNSGLGSYRSPAKPGIGKSRLAREFMNHVDGFSETIFWHQGRSPSYGDGLPMWAVGEMIRQRAGIAEDEESSRARTRLRTCLAEFVPDDQDRQWIEGWLAGLLGLGEMPAGGGF